MIAIGFFLVSALAIGGLALSEIFGTYWSGGAAPSINKRPELTADTSIVSDFTLAAGTVTDQQQQIGFDVANIKGVLITVEDNDLAVVVMETNATDHSGGHIFTFPIGGGELYWSARAPSEFTNPFGSTDVTTTYWTKSGADTPTVRIRVFLNA